MNASRASVKNPVSFAALMPHAPVLVPPVGGGRVAEVAASIGAMEEIARQLAARRPETLVLISPHSPRRPGAFGVWAGERLRGALDQFGAPEEMIDLPIDQSLAAELEQQARARGLATWEIRDRPLDHGAMVPLWFVAQAGWQGPTVVLSLNEPGEGRMVELGEAIAAAAQTAGRRIAIIASGDMSHRLKLAAPAGFHPRAKQFDRAFIDLLRAGAYRNVLEIDPDLRELAAEDVVDSTLVALAAVAWAADEHRVLSYEGPFGVGYGVAILFAPEPNDPTPEALPGTVAQTSGGNESGAALPRLARQSVAAALRGETAYQPDNVTGYLAERHGVFVTLRTLGDQLRGCVGTMSAQCGNLAEETWRIAREAALADHRFPPLADGELAGVRFEVSVVHPAENIASEDELDPQRYGVVVSTADGRRGVLLPDIPGIDTGDRQVRVARKKAGIGLWEKVQLARFEVDKFLESENDLML